MIPKVIHYCWFGNKKKPKLILDCIESWKVLLPEYQIIEWNETNSDLSHQFVKNSYELKKWAFVSDYIRLKILYENGGIYLDTDMMLVKSLNDLLENDCFFGAENEHHISAGIIGCKKNNHFVEKCLKQYDLIEISSKINLQEITIPKIITKLFKTFYKFDNYEFDQILKLQNIVIYPAIFFYPLSFDLKKEAKKYKNYVLTETYAVHLWNESWIDSNEFEYLRNKEYKSGLKIFLKKIYSEKKIKLSYLNKILSSLKIGILKKN